MSTRYQKAKNSLSEMKSKKLDILIEEKKRAETNIIFIVKTYSYAFGFLFVYTGFVAKTFVQVEGFKLEEPSFAKYAISALGLFLIMVVSVFGKYGTMAIAHSVKRRLEFTYDMNKILNKGNILKGLSFEHFLKVPIIYTWTTTIILAGSVFYFILMLGYENPYSYSGAMIISLAGLAFFPKTNAQYFNKLNNTLKSIHTEIKEEYIEENYIDKSTINNSVLKITRLLALAIFVYIEFLLIFFHEEINNRLMIYGCLLTLFILIEYVDTKRRTHRECFIDKIKNPFSK